MADNETQELQHNVPSAFDDVLIEEEESPEQQNPSGIPQVGGEVNLTDVAVPKESGVDVQANGHEKKTRLSTRDENSRKRKSWLLTTPEAQGVDGAGTFEEQKMFAREVEMFHRENYLEYKTVKFYGQPLNILKLWREVVKLGGYEVVTSSKLWRQVGESFHPPKTCTTVSYTFRNFYEKALLEYEKYLRNNGELDLPGSTLALPSSAEKEAISHQGSGSGRVRRDSAARAMQGWHAQRSGEAAEPILKDKGVSSTPKHKKLKSIGFSGLQKHKTQTGMDLVGSHDAYNQSVAGVSDDGPLADWVKINVKQTEDSFEVYALVPGLLRDEVRIQSDPAGRLIISGEPEQLDNPWGITPFRKVISLPTRIDPLHTSAVMSMHGRLFVRVPFEQ